MKNHWLLLALAIACLLCVSMQAQESDTGAARLSSAEGQLRITQGGQDLANPAPANAPLFDGAQLISSGDGKAEVQFENGGVARISPNSALTIIALNGPYGTEISLDSGLGYFELPDGASGQMRIHFGSSIVTLSGASVLRIRLDTLPGEVAVFSGTARLERAGMQPLDLQGEQSVTLSADNPAQYELTQITTDSWDSWNSDRDAALNAEASNRTEATSSVAGQNSSGAAWSDLDANGSWYDVPGQGYVWSPYAASNSGWDPYGCGRWMWTPSRGYVWVSCESWGFLPYMCGSWDYFDGFGWGWAPGAGYGCGGGWSLTHFGGVHIRRAPTGYLPIARPKPGPRRPVAGPTAPVVIVRREPRKGSEGLPIRTRNAPIMIGGQTIRPIAPIPTRSGFRPSNQGQAAPIVGKSGAHFSAPTSVDSLPSKQANTPAPVQRPNYPHATPGTPAGQSFAHPNQPVQAPTVPQNATQPAKPAPHSIFSGWKPVGGSAPNTGGNNANRPPNTIPSGSRPVGGVPHPAPNVPHAAPSMPHPAPSGGGSHPAPSNNGGGHR